MAPGKLANDQKAELAPKAGAIEGQIEALRSLGGRCAQRVGRLRRTIRENYLEPAVDARTLDLVQAMLETVKDELALEEWSDRGRGHVVFQLTERLADAPDALPYVEANIEKWLIYHRNEGLKAALCLGVAPPDGIAVLRVLDSGASKQVFVARWPEVTSRPVALKHFKGFLGRGQNHLGDAFPHPLRGHHQNIIETFVVSEDKKTGEVFLVERLLSQTLKDGWDFGGIAEVVNLIRDIANALSFVHGQSHMHGDIKLDNMGIEGGSYILLDFGLCRPEATADCVWTPTGNLRTRAPELLRDSQPNSAASDIWALGAVAFQALVGRPPFFDRGERQAGFVGEARKEKIEELAKQADPESWAERIGRPLEEHVHEHSLRKLLGRMLAYNPEERPSAFEVVRMCDSTLGWLIRPAEPTVELPPEAEIQQFEYLEVKGNLSKVSFARGLGLRERLERLSEGSLSPGDRDRLNKIEKAL